MQIHGTITKATPPGDPYGQYNTRYAFSCLMDGQGVEHNLVWVNRDPRPIENQQVTINDTSEKQEKIKYEQDKKGQMRYRIMGTGVSIMNGQGIDLSPQTALNSQPAQGPMQGATPPHLQGQGTFPNSGNSGPVAPHQQVVQGVSMREIIDYGIDCVRYAREQGEKDTAILVDVYKSAMYGAKEGRPLGLPERNLADAAKNTFDATQKGELSEEEQDDIPF